MTKAVLISGSSRGIGLSTAKLLAQRNNKFASIVMIARPSQRFCEAVEEVKSIALNCQIIKIAADLSDPDVVVKIYDEVDKIGVRVATIINNAGFTKPASINEASLADFDQTMRVNLYTPFRFIQEALHRNYPLRQVINIASTAGITGRGGWLTYSTSKAAIINMSEVLREELTPYGVDVFCISPGRCATDLRRALAPDEDPRAIMQPEQVASVIALLISESGQLLKTQNLVVRT